MIRLASAVLALLALFAPLAQASSFEACPTGKGIPEGPSMARNIAEWLKGDGAKVKTIDDFMCCLPKGFRDEFVIAHSSISAQASHYRSPRVIMKLDDAFLSVSGGDPALPQSRSAELMELNPDDQRLEFYDIDFSGQPTVSRKNPETCMACHGASEQNARFGPHPNFDPPSRWPRFVNGVTQMMCKEKNDPTALINETALAALEVPRLKKCLNLDAADVSRQVSNLFFFDGQLLRMNAYMVARAIRASADYEAFKYVIAGAIYCNQRHRELLTVRDWIPAAVMKKITNTSSLLDVIRDSRDLAAGVRLALNDEFTRFKKSEAYLATLAPSIRAGQNPSFEMYQGIARCQDPRHFPARLWDKIQSKRQGDPLVDKYIADSYLRASGAIGESNANDDDLDAILETTDPILRYVLEGRGLSMDTWDMQATAATYTRDVASLGFLMSAILDQEPRGSELRTFPQLRTFGGADVDHETCEELRRLSNEALKPRTPASAATSGSKAAKTGRAAGPAAKRAAASAKKAAPAKAPRASKKKAAP